MSKVTQPSGPADGTPATNEFLRPREAAEYLGLSESTLAKLRMRENRGKGPVFCRPLGRYVVYRKRDLEAWLDQSLVH